MFQGNNYVTVVTVCFWLCSAGLIFGQDLGLECPLHSIEVGSYCCMHFEEGLCIPEDYRSWAMPEPTVTVQIRILEMVIREGTTHKRRLTMFLLMQTCLSKCFNNVGHLTCLCGIQLLLERNL